MFQAMKFENKILYLINQLDLPLKENWIPCTQASEVTEAIISMKVRGAPAIACAAAYGLVLEAQQGEKKKGPHSSWKEISASFLSSFDHLINSRPTAINLFNGLSECQSTFISKWQPDTPIHRIIEDLTQFADDLFQSDLQTCQAIGEHGCGILKWLSPKKEVRILTHCNTGSLATAGYGTALGVIRSLHKKKALKHVFADETRPFLQGARLTCFELYKEQIPHTLIVDGAAPWLMHSGKVDAVIVGADRICRNGDTANKIGTYGVAVQAHHHQIPFFVAAPLTTFDFNLASGKDIPIEERSADEVTCWGAQRTAPKETSAWNPSFDVTPGNLISGFITEKGIVEPPYDRTKWSA